MVIGKIALICDINALQNRYMYLSIHVRALVGQRKYSLNQLHVLLYVTDMLPFEKFIRKSCYILYYTQPLSLLHINRGHDGNIKT